MKAREMFDSCHARYRGLQEWLADSTGQVRALDWEKTPPMKSWISLLGPWLGLAGIAAIVAPFIIY